ncbi:MAG: spore coat protein U domain-containing protein [Alphaproteobacteria bacterium]|nr:spore coat protein U domain-containing protein [Alphaproteobacteria bacterium]
MHANVKAMLAAAMLAALAGEASAQSCTFSNTGIDFGNVNLTSGGFQSATGTFSADCSGAPGQTIRICPNFNAGSAGIDPSGSPRFLAQGAIKLRFDIFRNNGVGQQWGSYTWGYSSRPPVLTVNLDGNGMGAVSQTVFGRLYNQQSTLPTGTYVSTFGGTHTQIDYGYSPGFSCGPTLSPRVQNVPFTVRATNNSSCAVTATDMDFGAHADLSSPVQTTNTITVTCTAGTQFDIGLSNGSSGAPGPAQRQMTNTATGEVINYGIYRDGGRTQIWGSTSGVNTVGSTSTGLTQTFTGYGRVPSQPTPSTQTYTDNIVVVVSY